MLLRVYNWLCTQKLVLAALGAPYGMLSIEPGSALCKAIILPTLLSLQHLSLLTWPCIPLGNIKLCKESGIFLWLIFGSRHAHLFLLLYYFCVAPRQRLFFVSTLCAQLTMSFYSVFFQSLLEIFPHESTNILLFISFSFLSQE